MSDLPGLEFFNNLSGKLTVELTEPTVRIAPQLLNEAAPPSAQILSVRLDVQVFEREEERFRPLTDQEFAQVALRAPRLVLRAESGGTVEHPAPNGEFFTVSDLVLAVEETERRTRNESEWFGGVDVHHCYFEGLEEEHDGVWCICWGS